MKYITGFFMAWGNFISLPCPCKRWDSDLKNIMLGFLPCIGFIIGAIWTGIYFGMVYLSLPFMIVSSIMTFLPWALCGFMHLDGFMDCTDAIMSRKPMAQKQAILKDSHTGAFAVIGMVFYVLAYFAFMTSAISKGIDFVNPILIPIISRGISAMEVLRNKPMGHSQYSEGASAENTMEKKKTICLIWVQFIVFLGLGFWCSSSYLTTVLVVLGTGLSAFISIAYARKQLGGMSGDLAGYGIVWGELIGVLALALF